MYCFAAAFVLVAALALASGARAAGPPHYELEIALDPGTRRLQVAGTVTFASGPGATFVLDRNFALSRLEVDGRAVEPVRAAPDGSTRWTVEAAPGRPVEVSIAYAGVLEPLDPQLDHREVLGLTQPVSGAQGAFLPAGSGWYPQIAGARSTWRVRARVRTPYHAVMPGRLVHERIAGEWREALFESRVPLPGIDLMAGPYSVAASTVKLASGRELPVRTYFHPELAALSAGYLESAAEHLARYDRAIGAYAFEAYSIVSSPLPTGFGMPDLAYLGREVLRLPFIRATSLRHEVLHDWWGNGVVPDPAEGNWAEGLTTLLADHAQREEQGPDVARALRLRWLRDYAAVPPKLDRPLTQFVARRHGADQAVGYNKTAFVFFMLRDHIGAEAFGAGLQRLWREHRFQTAGWSDLRRAFEAESTVELDWFFAQWVERTGAPLLEVAHAKHSSVHGTHRVAIVLRQQGTEYRLRVPVRVVLERGATVALVEMPGAQARAEIEVASRPRFVEIDPQVRLFRRLHPEEIAPTLRPVLIHPGARVMLAAADARTREAALAVAGAALEAPVSLLDPAQPSPRVPLLIVGQHAEVERLLQRLAFDERQVPGAQAGAPYAYAWRTPDGMPYAVVSAPDADALAALARSLPHLGAQSYAVFDGPRSTARGVWPMQPRRYPVGG